MKEIYGLKILTKSGNRHRIAIIRIREACVIQQQCIFISVLDLFINNRCNMRMNESRIQTIFPFQMKTKNYFIFCNASLDWRSGGMFINYALHYMQKKIIGKFDIFHGKFLNLS